MFLAGKIRFHALGFIDKNNRKSKFFKHDSHWDERTLHLDNLMGIGRTTPLQEPLRTISYIKLAVFIIVRGGGTLVQS